MIIQFFDNDSKQLIFKGAYIDNLDGKLVKEITKFQVEDGSLRSFNIVEKAKEMSITLILSKDDNNENKQDFLELLDYFNNDKLLTVQTKLEIYENMLIESMPHTENSSNYYGGKIDMTLTEWRGIKAQYGNLKQNPKNEAAQRTGTQSGTEVEDKKSKSILYGWANDK